MRSALLAFILWTIFAIPCLADVAMQNTMPTETMVTSSPHTVTYNIGLFSQYIFRGLTQTAGKPAVQGGIDYSHSRGFYVGGWASNISWLEDNRSYDNASLELDLYGGYRNSIGKTGLSYDVGVLQYVYPGQVKSGLKNAETTEVYGALSYNWLQAKLSYALSNGVFGVMEAQGSYYAELNAYVPLADSGITALLHLARQYFAGSVDGVSNSSFYSYTDWKIGASKSFSNGVNIGGYYTNVNANNRTSYSGAVYQGGAIDTGRFTVFVQKMF